MFVLKVRFCASTRGPHTQLTALWAAGRFLPLWASSPAWQRRLDVIKAYTPSAIRGCVKWALLLPNVLTISVCLHHSCEISQKGSQRRWPELNVHLVISFTFSLSFLLLFFFLMSVLNVLHVLVKGWWVSHITTSKTHCQDTFKSYEKKKKASEKYDHSCKMDQLFPIDNLQSPLLLADSAK